MPINEQLDIAVVVLNWNGEEDSLACIDALSHQTQKHAIVAVDNNSSDNFVETIKADYPSIVLLENNKNYGFAGGVNTGIRYAMDENYDYIALINNDAVPEKKWLESLVLAMQSDERIGIATGKLLKTDGLIDSTGDTYTSWGLAYPRGRNEEDKGQYDEAEFVFAGTGGASLYKTTMLKEIGLFDEDFFAYYEDVDLSFRAQLAGWKVVYTPNAIAHHKIGASSSKVGGLTTYMTIKNLPWLFWKNVPLSLMPVVLPRLFIAYTSFVFSALLRGDIIPLIKGLFVSTYKFPKKLLERHKIQKSRKATDNHIKSLITYDLPPNAHKLRKISSIFRRLSF